MIVLKKIDFYGQLFICSVSILAGTLTFNIHIAALIFFLAIGCWQLVSALIHLFFRNNFLLSKERKPYCLLALSYALLFWVSFSYHIGTAQFILIYLSLVPGIFYLKITHRELDIWQHRHFIQLK